MKKTTLKSVISTLFFSLLLTTTSISQELTYEIPLIEQVQSATQIVEGKVLSKESFWDVNQQNIYTANTIEVYKVFKGQTTLTTIEVITNGGVVGLEAEIVTPSLELSKGDIGLFMLYDNPISVVTRTSAQNKFRPIGSVQGFYKYNLVDDIAANPYRTKQGITSTLYNDIMGLTNANYQELSRFSATPPTISNQRGVIAISSLSPTTTTAGTQTVLTIDGGGFGASQGTVSFKDPNTGGSTYKVALDSQIISWSDSQIQVEIPSRSGTGNVRVTSALSNIATSSQTITIDYAESNVEYDPGSGTTAYITQHVNKNGSGGYTWQMFTDFNNNASANASFMRAFDTWVCETGINWEVGATSTVDVIANDGVNIIRFDIGTELDSGILGRCTSRLSGCLVGGVDLFWYVNEMDIVFNDSTNWQYGPANAGSTQTDFETVAVHELGHGHQLVHVIDSNKIMHYAIGSGTTNRVLSANDISGGNDVQSRSTSSSVCSQLSMTNSSCFTLSVNETILSENISIFPNPAKNSLSIKNASSIDLNSATVYDVRGRLISKIDINQTAAVNTINISNLHSGMYFIKIESDKASITKKIIIE